MNAAASPPRSGGDFGHSPRQVPRQPPRLEHVLETGPRPVLRQPRTPRMSTAGSIAMVVFAFLAAIGVLAAGSASSS